MYCHQGRNDNSNTAKICLKMNKKQHTKKLIIKILIILDFKILSMYFTISSIDFIIPLHMKIMNYLVFR